MKFFKSDKPMNSRQKADVLRLIKPSLVLRRLFKTPIPKSAKGLRTS